MEDSELAAIRARRLAELKASAPASGSPVSGLPIGGMAATGGAGSSSDESKKRDMEEMRRNMLYQVLDNDARERLARINIVKPEKARGVEDMILRMAQTGQIRSKVTEKQLIDMLETIAEQQQASTKITYNRRRDMDSDDDEDWGL